MNSKHRITIIIVLVFLIGSLFVSNVAFAQSPVPNGNGDACSPVGVSTADIKCVLQNWLANLTNALDQYKEGKINVLDFAVVRKFLPPPTATPEPSPTPASIGSYLLIDSSEMAVLPTNTPAYTYVKGLADGNWPSPDLCNQDVKHGVYILSAALMYARIGVQSYKDKVITGINSAVLTQQDGCTNAVLSMGRQLGSYVLAADFIGFRDPSFVSWVSQIRTRNLGGHSRWYTLRVTEDDSNNNWGGWARASVTAADLYLNDTSATLHDVAVLKGFLGDRNAYHNFRGQKDTSLYTEEKTWACQLYDPNTFVPLNSPCDVERDGVIAGDTYRGPTVCCTPSGTGLSYVTEVLQGTFIQAELLRRAGYDLWSYENSALRRAGDWLARFSGWNYSSISYGNAWLANKRLGAGSYPTKTPTFGRMIAGYDWLWGN